MLKSYSELPTEHVIAMCVMVCILFISTGVTVAHVFGPQFDPVEYCLESSSAVERCNESKVLWEEAAE